MNFETPPFDPPPPKEIDELWRVKAATTQLGRRVERAAREGRLSRQWAARIEQALGRVLSECDRARAAGALRPADPERPGASVEIQGLAAFEARLAAHEFQFRNRPTDLPTEASRAAEEAAVVGT